MNDKKHYEPEWYEIIKKLITKVEKEQHRPKRIGSENAEKLWKENGYNVSQSN